MPTKRPLLPKADRNQLQHMAHRASQHVDQYDPNRAYAQGVTDVLRWLTGDDYDMSPLLKEVTR